jgi:hypothetical protein
VDTDPQPREENEDENTKEENNYKESNNKCRDKEKKEILRCKEEEGQDEWE